MSNHRVYINGRFLTQQITGVQRFAFEICRYLQHSTIEFVVAIPPGTEIPKTLSHLQFETVGKNRGYIWEQIELPTYLKKQRSPLLINFCNTAPLVYKNQWVTIHDLAFMHHPEWFSKSFARVYRFLIPRIVKRSKKVLTVSKTVRAQLSKTFGIPIDSIGIVYNGIPHELLHYKVNSHEKRNTILTVSSINPRKNLPFLIDSFLESGLDNYQLVVVGAQNNVFSSTNYKSHPNVLFTGYISNNELYQLYHEAKLFVSLSLDEGFGIPVLEALYCGCPVLISDIDIYKECFRDVAAFTSAVDSKLAAFALWSTLKHEPIAQSVQKLTALYNYEASALSLIKLLRETAEKM
jgi:glycosyltransferase involved in cell wall biosynthesis